MPREAGIGIDRWRHPSGDRTRRDRFNCRHRPWCRAQSIGAGSSFRGQHYCAQHNQRVAAPSGVQPGFGGPPRSAAHGVRCRGDDPRSRARSVYPKPNPSGNARTRLMSRKSAVRILGRLEWLGRARRKSSSSRAFSVERRSARLVCFFFFARPAGTRVIGPSTAGIAARHQRDRCGRSSPTTGPGFPEETVNS